MRCTIVMAAALVLAGLAVPSRAGEIGEIKGAPRVISGDTLMLAGQRLRLYGVDAPELGQRCRLANGRRYDCGLVSTTALMDLTAGVSITCRPRPDRTDGEIFATCFAGGYDLSHGMAHTGWALAWPETGTIYAGVQERARKARRGLWQGAFVAPWQWRAGRRLADPTGAR